MLWGYGWNMQKITDLILTVTILHESYEVFHIPMAVTILICSVQRDPSYSVEQLTSMKRKIAGKTDVNYCLR